MPHRSLQDEIGKAKPFDVPEQEAYLNLVRTANLLETAFDRFFRTHALSHATHNALRIIRGHGDKGVPSQTIAKHLITPVPDVTRLVDRLVEAGFAERSRVSTDRRVVMVKITRRGVDLLARLDADVIALHKQQFAHMSAKDIAELSRLSFLARQNQSESESPTE